MIPNGGRVVSIFPASEKIFKGLVLRGCWQRIAFESWAVSPHLTCESYRDRVGLPGLRFRLRFFHDNALRQQRSHMVRSTSTVLCGLTGDAEGIQYCSKKLLGPGVIGQTTIGGNGVTGANHHQPGFTCEASVSAALFRKSRSAGHD
jgi:hypothetical protein